MGKWRLARSRLLRRARPRRGLLTVDRADIRPDGSFYTVWRIYDWHIAPNPRRLHIFLAEKGITVDLVEVGQADLTLPAWFKERYPHAMVPMLELDDGTQIGEAMAIARYFEETHPEPPLIGHDARDKAIVEMWEKRANEEGMLPASELFRNTHPNFAERPAGGR